MMGHKVRSCSVVASRHHVSTTGFQSSPPRSSRFFPAFLPCPLGQNRQSSPTGVWMASGHDSAICRDVFIKMNEEVDEASASAPTVRMGSRVWNWEVPRRRK